MEDRLSALEALQRERHELLKAITLQLASVLQYASSVPSQPTKQNRCSFDHIQEADNGYESQNALSCHYEPAFSSQDVKEAGVVETDTSVLLSSSFDKHIEREQSSAVDTEKHKERSTHPDTVILLAVDNAGNEVTDGREEELSRDGSPVQTSDTADCEEEVDGEQPPSSLSGDEEIQTSKASTLTPYQSPSHSLVLDDLSLNYSAVARTSQSNVQLPHYENGSLPPSGTEHLLGGKRSVQLMSHKTCTEMQPSTRDAGQRFTQSVSEGSSTFSSPTPRPVFIPQRKCSQSSAASPGRDLNMPRSSSLPLRTGAESRFVKAAITLSRNSGSGFRQHTVYTCVVWDNRGSRYTAGHRYTDFVELRERIVGFYPSLADQLPELPEKKFVGKFRQAFIDQRRQGLEQFLQFILGHPVLNQHQENFFRPWFLKTRSDSS